MNLGIAKRTPILIAVGVITLVCFAQVYRPHFSERLERLTYDWRVRQAAKFSPVAATNLGFVTVTEDSIRLVKRGLLDGRPYGLYWPRHIYGRMLEELEAEGVKSVAFDILFAELRSDQDPLSIRDPVTQKYQLLESDEVLAQAMKRGSNVIIAAQEQLMPPALFRTNAAAVGVIDADQDADGTLRHARVFKTYRKWHSIFEQLEADRDYGVDLSQAKIETNHLIFPRSAPDEPIIFPLDKYGNFDLVDFAGTNIPAGMLRYNKPFTEERIWHMGIVLAARELGLDLAHAEVDFAQHRVVLHGANGVERIIPVDDDGYFYIDWCLPPNDHRLTSAPVEELLSQYQVSHEQATNEPAVSLAAFYRKKNIDWHDKLIVVGSAATGNDLTDRGATPLLKSTLLFSEHWNVANSVIMGRFIHRAPLSVELLLIIIMGVSAAYVTEVCKSATAALWVLVVVGIYVGLSLWMFISLRYWIPLVFPVGGTLLTHFSLLAYLVFFEQAERRRLRYVFGKMVSPDIAAELEKSDTNSLKGGQQKVTVFFSDIRGFTEMTDVNRAKVDDYIKENNLVDAAADEVRHAEARETLNTVNQYLKIIAGVVLKHNGTVDKFIGDCVMAFWGAPVQHPQHALFCVRAAIDTQRAVYAFNQERLTENRQREAQNLMLAADGKPLLELLPTLVVGTGINTGVVTVGLMGSDERANYTVFGREVNLASRLETVSGRARIIISEATLAEIIQDDPTLALSCKPLPPEKVKGIREPVRIYEVPWREGGATEDAIPAQPADAYNTGYFVAADPTSDTATTVFKQKP